MQRRDSGYIRKGLLEMELPSREEKGKTKEKVYGCSAGGHDGNWCDAGGCGE